MKINIVLPFFNQKPVGGIKVMYQYANQLADRGHDVMIYHAMYTSWMPKGGQGFRKKKHKFFQHVLRLKRPVSPSWYRLHDSIRSIEVIDVSNDLIRDADVIFSTWWATALEVFQLDRSKGEKFNLIQDAEDIMTDHPDLVYQSYRLPINHIVIARYLRETIEGHQGDVSAVIPNAIKPEEFHVRTPTVERDPHSIIMLYAEVERKGTIYGLEALKIAAVKYPQLKVTLFGVIEEPKFELPANIAYHFKPDNLAEMYNRSAIFISPSVHEGWGLPAMEAMACGCACVCTNIEGHLDFMTDGETALLVPPVNSEALAEAVISLIEDRELRLRIAQAGIENVKNFSWQQSADKLEQLFKLSLSGANL